MAKLSKELFEWVVERVEKGDSVRLVAEKLKDQHGVKISHQALSKRLRKLRAQQKVAKDTTPTPTIEEKITQLEGRSFGVTKKTTMFDLHVKVLKYLNENDNELTKLALRNLPKGWGGSMKKGGGWSGHWLCLLEILEQIGVYVEK